MTFSKMAMMGMGLLAFAALAVADEKETPKAAPPSDATIQTTRQKVSYGIGLNIGTQMKSQSVELDVDLLTRGIKDGLGGKPQLTPQQIQEAMIAFQKELEAQKAKEGEAQAEAGKKFLAENKTKPGIATTKSGLQYKILTEGTGKSPKPSDTVTVNYTGKLIDGTVFDSSEKNGGPANFPVNGVIPGFTEALQLMKVGSKFQIYIPSELAYGAQPRPGGPIPPNAMLIFDLELVGVK